MLKYLLPNNLRFPAADGTQLTQGLSLLSVVVNMREYNAGGGRPEALCRRLATLISKLHIFPSPRLLWLLACIKSLCVDFRNLTCFRFYRRCGMLQKCCLARRCRLHGLKRIKDSMPLVLSIHVPSLWVDRGRRNIDWFKLIADICFFIDHKCVSRVSHLYVRRDIQSETLRNTSKLIMVIWCVSPPLCMHINIHSEGWLDPLCCPGAQHFVFRRTLPRSSRDRYVGLL